jgi:ABC-type sugar transport system, periplasmic component
MSIRKVVSLLVCAILVITMFAACGSSNSPAATTAGDQTTTQAVTTQKAETSVQPASIGFFHWKGEEKDTWDKIIKMFQDQNPGITVNMEILPEDQYYTKLQAEVMSGEGLDVFEVNPGSRFQTFLKADAYMDLTGQPFLADLNPLFLGAGQVDGKQYIVPISKSFIGLFYNKKILSDLGLQVPTTWDDFLKVCAAIKASGKEVIATGMADSFTSTWPFIDMLAENSEDLQVYPKLAHGEMKFTDPLFKDVLSPLNELAKKGYWMKNANGTKYDASISLFATGKAAMLNNGTWAIGAIRKINPDLDFSIMLLPSPKGKLVAGVAPAQAPCVFSKTKNKDASLKFMNFIFSKEAMEIYGNETGQEVPNTKAVLTDKDLTSMAPVGNSGQLYAHYNSQWSEIDQGIVAEMTTRAMLGEDIDKITADAQKKLEALNIPKQ